MLIAAHATRTEDGTYRVRLVLAPTPDIEERLTDPLPADVLEAVTTAVWSLGFLSRRDSHSLEAAQVPRQAVRTVAREMVRTAVATVAVWREMELPFPEVTALQIGRAHV